MKSDDNICIYCRWMQWLSMYLYLFLIKVSFGLWIRVGVLPNVPQVNESYENALIMPGMYSVTARRLSMTWWILASEVSNLEVMLVARTNIDDSTELSTFSDECGENLDSHSSILQSTTCTHLRRSPTDEFHLPSCLYVYLRQIFGWSGAIGRTNLCAVAQFGL